MFITRIGVPLLALTGCIPDPPSSDDLDARVSALEALVSTQADTITTLQATVGAQTTTITQLQADLSGVDDQVATIVKAPYATEGWVASQGYLTAADLGEYATTSYVDAGDQADRDYADLGYDENAAQIQILQDSDVTQDGRLDALEAECLRSGDTSVARYIESDTTIEVGAARTFTDLSVALASLDGSVIAGDATVTLALDDGFYPLGAPLRLNHPSGARIHIVGNTSDPSHVVLSFAASDGVVVEGGSSLGWLGGVTLEGDPSVLANGLTVQNGSSAILGPLVVQDFGGYGIVVTDGSTLDADEAYRNTLGWVTITNSGDIGLTVVRNSVAYLPYADINGVGDVGVRVEGSSCLEGQWMEVSGRDGEGITIDRGSFAVLNGVYVHDNDNGGVFVTGASGAEGEEAVSQRNGGDGFYSGSGAWADFEGARAESNVGDGFSSEYSGALDATVSRATSNGDINYQSSSGGTIFAGYSTSESPVAGIDYQASLYSFIRADGSNAGGRNTGYWQSENSYIEAEGATGLTTTNSLNNTDPGDFIYGL